MLMVIGQMKVTPRPVPSERLRSVGSRASASSPGTGSLRDRSSAWSSSVASGGQAICRKLQGTLSLQVAQYFPEGSQPCAVTLTITCLSSLCEICKLVGCVNGRR